MTKSEQFIETKKNKTEQGNFSRCLLIGLCLVWN